VVKGLSPIVNILTGVIQAMIRMETIPAITLTPTITTNTTAITKPSASQANTKDAMGRIHSPPQSTEQY
jgi:hypothetical protein